MSFRRFLIPTPGALLGLGLFWMLSGLCFAADGVPPDEWPTMAAGMVVAAAFACAGGVGVVRQMAQQRAESRRLRGQCARCGYNLIGNVSGVCPECGNPK